MRTTVGTFRDEQARSRFRGLLDAALASWPERDDHEVATTYGTTVVSVTKESGNGVPLVLLQGGGSTIAAWSRLADAWRANRPVITIDTIWDAGRSVQRRPVTDGADAAAWLSETLSGLALDDVHLLGYSYGGWVGLNQATHSGGRPSSGHRVRSVTAIEPPGAITGMPPVAWWQLLRTFSGDPGRYRSFLAWVRRGHLPEPPMLELLLSAHTDFVRRGTPRPRRLSRAQWQAIDCPALVVLGRASRFIPRRAASVLRGRAPRAEVHVLPDVGHAVPAEAPDTTIAVVEDFLARASCRG